MMVRRRRYLSPRLLLGIVIVGFVTMPFVFMISTSFKPPTEQLQAPPTILPRQPTLGNYSEILGEAIFVRYLVNSLVVTVATTVIAICLATVATFGFTRLNLRGARTMLVAVVLGQLVPLAAIAVPLYQIAAELDLIDKLPALVLAYLALGLPVAVWMLRGYMVSIPKELEEAARVEGATSFQAFRKIVLPLSAPGIVATASYVFFLIWQEFLFVLIFTNRPENRTLPVGMLDFVGQYRTNWGNLMAASVVTAIPAVAAFMFIQRRIVNGLTEGAVK